MRTKRHALRWLGVPLICSVLLASGVVADASAGSSGTGVLCSSTQRAAAPNVCVAKGDPRGPQVLGIVRQLQARYSLKSVVFGVWDSGKPIVSGALGTSYPGVASTQGMHFRIGNVTETFETTLLLQLVDRGKIHLDDPVSKWLPGLPNGDRVTVGMLANSTAGYASFYTSDWTKEFDDDPFRAWTPSELISISTAQPLDFTPGTSWNFSDSNFVILGQILVKAGGAPVSAQLQRLILGPLHLHGTQMTPTSYIPSPVLHGYDAERGDYQDSTFWSISWAPNNGDMTSDLSDLGSWAKAWATGTLVSPKSHALQFAPDTAGRGPLTTKLYYAFGSVVANGWHLAEPALIGYTGLVSYLPQKKLTVVVFATANPDAPPNGQYSAAIFNRIGAALAPASAPGLPSTITHLPGA